VALVINAGGKTREGAYKELNKNLIFEAVVPQKSFKGGRPCV